MSGMRFNPFFHRHVHIYYVRNTHAQTLITDTIVSTLLPVSD